MDGEHRRESDPRIGELLVNRVDQMERGFEELRTTNKRVLIILDGEEKQNASGEITRVGGVSNDLAEVSKDVAELKVAMNGGKMRIKMTDKILLALIAASPPLLLYLATAVAGR